MEDAGCDLELALLWAVAAKNSLKNVHGFRPNQIVFGGKLNFPTALNSKLPAFEGKSSSEDQNLWECSLLYWRYCIL